VCDVGREMNVESYVCTCTPAYLPTYLIAEAACIPDMGSSVQKPLSVTEQPDEE
jgi:hypothetical protein